ncbi:MAG: hypothetical protein AAF715_04675 [Myxococcota bacterium]
MMERRGGFREVFEAAQRDGAHAATPRPRGQDGALGDAVRHAELHRPPRRATRVAVDALPACYLTLGLSRPEGCLLALRRAFRGRAQVVHPDRGGSHEAFLRLQAAYAEALARAPGGGTNAVVNRTASGN